MEQPPVGLDAAPPTAFDSGEAVRNEANESGTSQLQSAAAEHDETESYFEAASEGFADVAPQGPMAGTAHDAGVTGPADRQGAADSSPRAAAFGYGYDDPAAERASAASAPPENSSAGGSLDELFGAPAVPGEDEAAASMLARLYDPTAHSASAAPGSATRPASSELSLDQVFRETPRSLEAARRASFSFDQFFASAAEPSAATPDAAPGAQGDDDESAARDIEQFHAWLEGLKKK